MITASNVILRNAFGKRIEKTRTAVTCRRLSLLFLFWLCIRLMTTIALFCGNLASHPAQAPVQCRGNHESKHGEIRRDDVKPRPCVDTPLQEALRGHCIRAHSATERKDAKETAHRGGWVHFNEGETTDELTVVEQNLDDGGGFCFTDPRSTCALLSGTCFGVRIVCLPADVTDHHDEHSNDHEEV